MNSEAEIRGLGKRLVSSELIAQQELLEASNSARKEKIPLARYLVKNGLLGSDVIAETASNHFGLPRFNLTAIDRVSLSEAVPLVDEKLIKKHNILPLQKKRQSCQPGCIRPF